MDKDQPDSGIVISADKIVLLFGLVTQICAIVWIVAIMHSSTEYNKESLKEINSKLTTAFTKVDTEVSDIRVRLRAAEKEISIMSSIMDIEFRRRNNEINE